MNVNKTPVECLHTEPRASVDMTNLAIKILHFLEMLILLLVQVLDLVFLIVLLQQLDSTKVHLMVLLGRRHYDLWLVYECRMTKSQSSGGFQKMLQYSQFRNIYMIIDQKK